MQVPMFESGQLGVYDGGASLCVALDRDCCCGSSHPDEVSLDLVAVEGFRDALNVWLQQSVVAHRARYELRKDDVVVFALDLSLGFFRVSNQRFPGYPNGYRWTATRCDGQVFLCETEGDAVRSPSPSVWLEGL